MARARRKSNVLSLRGAAPPIPQVVPNVVDALDGLLRQAKDGAIVGFAYVFVAPQGHTYEGWVGIAEQDNLVAGVARLSHRVLSAACKLAPCIAVAAALLSMPVQAQTYITNVTTRCPGVTDRITVSMAGPSSKQYRMTIADLPGIPVDQQAVAVAPLLIAKRADPTTPSFDGFGFKKTASPMGWLILGKSIIGAGC